MAVGPLQPARMARMAMTMTLLSGCSRLTWQRGSGSRSNCSAISPRLVVVVVAIARSGSGREGSSTELAYGKGGDGATPYLATLSHSARWPWGSRSFQAVRCKPLPLLLFRDG